MKKRIKLGKFQITKHYYNVNGRNFPALELGKPLYTQSHANPKNRRTPEIDVFLLGGLCIVNANNNSTFYRRNDVDIKPMAENSVIGTPANPNFGRQQDLSKKNAR